MAWVNILEAVYPIGSIYVSTIGASPASFIGGTWEQIEDKFLVGAGAYFNAMDTGGEMEHTLTKDEMPRHNHTYNSSFTVQSSEGGGVSGIPRNVSSWGNYSPAHWFTIQDTGNNEPHNNLPPYYAVYIYRRTA